MKCEAERAFSYTISFKAEVSVVGWTNTSYFRATTCLRR
jgi:hypothetical protein